MEKFQQLREDAKKRLKVANHLLEVTYPSLKDPKLLVTALNSLHNSLENGMNSVLEHEKLFKRLSILPESAEPRLEIFRSEVGPNYKFKEEHSALIQEVRELLGCHEHSPVEFSKKDTFVICSDNYDIKTLSPEKLKKQVNQTKDFIRKVEEVVSKNEGIFRRSA